MKKNLGVIDKVVRILIAVVINPADFTIRISEKNIFGLYQINC